MNYKKIFLIITGVGLIPIALSYGLMPDKSLSYLFNISVDSTNLAHIFRAVMCLYLGFVTFWFMGAFSKKYRDPAVFSMTVFMLGLASGRIVSLIVDGIPHWLLLGYLGLELSCGVIGILLLRIKDKS